MRKEKKSIEEIAEMLGLSLGTVRSVCKENGLSGRIAKGRQDYAAIGRKVREANRKTEEEAKQYIEGFGIPFEYVGGYTNSDSKCDIKCKTCGAIINASVVAIRQGGYKTCVECSKAATRERRRIAKEKKQNRKHIDKSIREAQKEAERESKKRIAICVECGEQFTTYKQNKVCCSSECSRKRQNNHKDRRLKKVEYVDKSITLQSLYKRDGGVCYICRKKCNLEDYIVRDGTTICGDFYPSIDHVVPLSKGGSHSWDNVRLAHRLCNTIKSNCDYAINPHNGQMMLI